MTRASGLLVALLATAASGEDPRAQEAARLGCVAELGRSDVTLFANGTVRYRRRSQVSELEMMLAELSPEDLAAYLERLANEDLSEAKTQRGGVAGAWLETCTLTLALEGRPAQSFRFGALDALPLGLARAVGILRELETLAEERRPVESLPPDYVPRQGDVLLRQDGVRYQVEGLTSDGKAVELLGLDQPFTLYVALEALHGEFRRVVERR